PAYGHLEEKASSIRGVENSMEVGEEISGSQSSGSVLEAKHSNGSVTTLSQQRATGST
ncbi:hypothetical protein BGW38_007200, partial [Lunasporangiospora selenospora]